MRAVSSPQTCTAPWSSTRTQWTVTGTSYFLRAQQTTINYPYRCRFKIYTSGLDSDRIILKAKRSNKWRRPEALAFDIKMAEPRDWNEVLKYAFLIEIEFCFESLPYNIFESSSRIFFFRRRVHWMASIPASASTWPSPALHDPLSSTSTYPAASWSWHHGSVSWYLLTLYQEGKGISPVFAKPLQ